MSDMGVLLISRQLQELLQVPRLLHRGAKTFSEISEERLSLLDRLRRIAEITNLEFAYL